MQVEYKKSDSGGHVLRFTEDSRICVCDNGDRFEISHTGNYPPGFTLYDATGAEFIEAFERVQEKMRRAAGL